MSSRLAIFPLVVMIACSDVGVYARAQQSDKAQPWPPVLSPERPEGIPDDVPWPPPLDKLPPPPNPLPNVPSDVPIPKHGPIVCPPDKHRGPGPGGCVDGAPEMGVTEINGIPWEEALKILERHRDELHEIPGVAGSALGVNGIVLTVLPNHGDIPPAVEGLPIQIEPYQSMPWYDNHHTETERIRPFHGGVGFAPDFTVPNADCTVNTVVLAHGDPWAIFPAHCFEPFNCPEFIGQPQFPPPHCPTGTPLWQCPRYAGANMQIFQPADPGTAPADLVGWLQRFTLEGGSTQNPVPDLAAAAMDNNTVDRDFSLATHFNEPAEMDKALEGYGYLWQPTAHADGV